MLVILHFKTWLKKIFAYDIVPNRSMPNHDFKNNKKITNDTIFEMHIKTIGNYYKIAKLSELYPFIIESSCQY